MLKRSDYQRTMRRQIIYFRSYFNTRSENWFSRSTFIKHLCVFYIDTRYYEILTTRYRLYYLVPKRFFFCRQGLREVLWSSIRNFITYALFCRKVSFISQYVAFIKYFYLSSGLETTSRAVFSYPYSFNTCRTDDR